MEAAASPPDSERRILELFSGIGGMHSAFTLSGIKGHVVAAIDINTVANTVYAHNHPDTKLLTRNIQKIDAAMVRRLGVNTILMSPPCQPFTRTGKQQDVDDARTDALCHLCGLLGQLTAVDAVLMENVKGFESSRARQMYVSALREAGYHCSEFILSPSQLGVPNTRHRYYCLARKFAPFRFGGDRGDGDNNDDDRRPPMVAFPPECLLADDGGRLPYGRHIAHHLDDSGTDHRALLLPDDVLLRRGKVLDIAAPDAERSMCFTKAYTHYTEGTGSVFSEASKERIVEVFDRVAALTLADETNGAVGGGDGGDARLELLRSLGLRYFSPSEVARLMCFKIARCRLTAQEETDEGDHDDGSCFSFPLATTNRQRYRLLGNSINVLVVAKLIRLLFATNKLAE